ncbi:HU family DNA-binding protein [Campylobacter sp. RM9344]|uniref:HU family DNA-binding protein n=1 Tax=Campylobacter californiensis TaxID=1032243 RepID=A0AAW3ZWC1_9BACT|nr:MULTISPECIES: HU family DNA-binding protein [unclassified Campylobacter]MBE2984240.1 HU family DNA-binding protein [Campylobacter sp. RM6883]MBE2986005.1 HU family DNA-binding protein [Campylobacter sp. RM12919]MBE2988315.1 HU family DNA-binding protein [Campylobacter sp. RM12920]MBE2994893.1 HU family DNA-binding protein [Campylobacter sp. RM6913]MBE3021334.1 HU family DNA-binding protein [Campylobacter sp. 7477a]MBE3029469.1 HU family DNA-binding protein [Campylobacter sp. RM9344]
MKKAEFIQAVADKAGLSKKDSLKVVDAALETIAAALEKGDSVSFIGFGTFDTTERAARKARVPGTKQVIDVPASKAVKFKVGKKLKEAVAAAAAKKSKKK